MVKNLILQYYLYWCQIILYIENQLLFLLTSKWILIFNFRTEKGFFGLQGTSTDASSESVLRLYGKHVRFSRWTYGTGTARAKHDPSSISLWVLIQLVSRWITQSDWFILHIDRPVGLSNTECAHPRCI